MKNFSKVMTKIYEKKNGRLSLIGEGNVYKKSQVRLVNEAGITANMGQQPGVRQAIANANKVMNANPSVTGASTDAGKMDGTNDSGSGEGMKIQIPANANGQQISNIEKMTSSQGMDDAEVEVVKPNMASGSTNESKYRNAIPFSKRELNELFEEFAR